MDEDLFALTPPELAALAGLARVLIRLDGRFSSGEREMLRRIAASLAVPDDGGEHAADGPYREGAITEPLGEERWFALLDRAAEQLPNDEAVRAAARDVTRPEARAAIHALLFDLAASDVATGPELKLLGWLSDEWELDGRVGSGSVEGSET